MDREGKRQTPGRREQIPRLSPPLGCLCRTHRSRRSPRRSTNVPARVNARNRGARSSISSRCFANDRRWNPRWSTSCASRRRARVFSSLSPPRRRSTRGTRGCRGCRLTRRPNDVDRDERARGHLVGARDDTSAPSRPNQTRTFDSNASDEADTKTNARPRPGSRSGRANGSTGSERARTSTTHTRVGTDVRGGPPARGPRLVLTLLDPTHPDGPPRPPRSASGRASARGEQTRTGG